MTSSLSFTDGQKIDFEQITLDIDALPLNKIQYGCINIFEDRLGKKVGVPIITIVGNKRSPVVGITAAIHGNEINGMATIHNIVEYLRNKPIKGTVVCIPISNVSGYLLYQR